MRTVTQEGAGAPDPRDDLVVVNQELPGGWVAEFSYSPGSTTPEQLTIRPSQGGATSKLSSTVLRDVDFAAAAASLTSPTAPEVPDEALRNAHAAGADAPQYLALVAASFIGDMRAGRKPAESYERIGKVLGISPTTVRNHLWRGKRAGLVGNSHSAAATSLTSEGERVVRQALERVAET